MPCHVGIRHHWLAKDFWLAGSACILPGFIPCLHSFCSHTQDHDYVLYLCGGTSGIVWTVRFSLLSSKKMENEENSG